MTDLIISGLVFNFFLRFKLHVTVVAVPVRRCRRYNSKACSSLLKVIIRYTRVTEGSAVMMKKKKKKNRTNY